MPVDGRGRGSAPVGPLTRDPGVDRLGDLVITGAVGVLVDQRGPDGGVAHAVHQFPRARAGRGGDVVAGVAQVVEVERRGEARVHDHGWPADSPPPVARGQSAAPVTGEDRRLRVLSGELGQVTDDASGGASGPGMGGAARAPGETGGRWCTAEDRELLYGALYDGPDTHLAAVFARSRSIYACPNCAALAVEDDDGRYRYFVPEPSHVRIFADRSHTDALGGYGLAHPCSLQDLSAQKVIPTPGLTIIAYDQTGWSATCSIEPWVNPDDTLDEDRWVARHPGR